MKSRNKLNIRSAFPSLSGKVGKRPLTIAYLGASNTALEAGWRPVVQKWFNETVAPKGQHKEINASIGGTDSLTGAFTCSDIFKDGLPDLVFVEYSQPDINTFKEDKELLLCCVEVIIRTIKSLSPKTDICFLYFLHKNHLDDHKQGFTWAEEIYERVANHYGIPSINVAKHVTDIQSSGEMDLFPGGEHDPVFRADEVHPTPRGNEIITGFIEESLQRIIQKSHPVSCPSELPEQLSPYDLDNWNKINVIPEHIKGEYELKEEHVGQVRNKISYYCLKQGNELRLKLKGTLAGILSVVGPESGYISCEIDGERACVKNLFNQYCYRDMLAATRFIEKAADITDKPGEDYRQITIKLLDFVPEESGKMERPPAMEPQKWLFNPVSLFVIGDIKNA